MASKLKNRQKAEMDRVIAEKEAVETSTDTSEVKEEGDESQASNIASKIAQRRLPRRTPTSHVRGPSGDSIRRRLNQPNEDSSVTSCRYSIDTSFDQSFDEPPPGPSRQPCVEKPKKEASSKPQ
ncbi:unnamed protein product [Caenorhabditis sp. 36 PRJEB53466]|nr:unnamed protein product [Caenorhabditis sp. 36 PRJEB53466]